MMSIKAKHQRLRKLIKKENLDFIILQKNNNIAWLSSGFDNRIVDKSETGAISLLVSSDQIKIITDNIEFKRIKEEGKLPNSWEIEVYNWYESNYFLQELSKNKKIGSDIYQPGSKLISEKIRRLRYPLFQSEINKYKKLGREAAETIGNIAREIEIGQFEKEIKAKIYSKLLRKNILPHLVIVGSDHRIFQYRHPISTAKKINEYVMIVLCAERDGLIVNLSRLIHFGKPSFELKEKLNSVAKIDAAFILNTRPGVKVDQVLEAGKKAYKKQGYAGEWKNHHQGGAAGYQTREYIVTPEQEDIVQLNQPFTWNPSLTGVKSEDTILVKENENEIITFDHSWPMLESSYNGKNIKRPDILIK